MPAPARRASSSSARRTPRRSRAHVPPTSSLTRRTTGTTMASSRKRSRRRVGSARRSAPHERRRARPRRMSPSCFRAGGSTQQTDPFAVHDPDYFHQRARMHAVERIRNPYGPLYVQVQSTGEFRQLNSAEMDLIIKSPDTVLKTNRKAPNLVFIAPNCGVVGPVYSRCSRHDLWNPRVQQDIRVHVVESNELYPMNERQQTTFNDVVRMHYAKVDWERRWMRSDALNNVFFVSASGRHYLYTSQAASPLFLAARLRECYMDLHAPPAAAFDFLAQKPNALHKVTVYTFSEDLKAVQTIAQQRVPTLIGNPGQLTMPVDQYYRATLKMYFGYQESGYSTLAKEMCSTLPPNVAVYVDTHVYRRIAETSHEFKSCHVINLVGCALDAPWQPDHRYFVGTDNRHDDPKIIKHMSGMLLLAFACAQDIKKKKIMLALAGGGTFSALYKGDFVRNCFIPALREALHTCSTYNIHRPKSIGLMGSTVKYVDVTSLVEFISSCQFSVDFKYFPKDVPEVCFIEDSDDYLYVNAWDPHSVVGNGNSNDISLDGFFGRNSTMAYACTASVNQAMSLRVVGNNSHSSSKIPLFSPARAS